MKHKITDRGFKHMESVPGYYGGEGRLYESSGSTPSVWLQIEEPNSLNNWAAGDKSGGTHEATLLLTAENAWKLKQQIEWLLENHFLGDLRPQESQTP